MKPLLFFICCFNLCHLTAQNDNAWLVRIGAVGTGTFDEGIWTFNDQTGLGQQKFTFGNSWGIGLTIHYRYNDQWKTGVHLALSYTSFELEITDNAFGTISDRDYTTFNPLLIEQLYQFRKAKAFRPYIGLCAGALFTRNIKLTIPPATNPTAFTFVNPFIFGFAIGVDYEFGTSGLFLQTSIRGLNFEYTLKETAVTNEQTLLDQVFWMNYNHIQIGIGKRL